jgi:dTDP-4-amino-4,6-dideoxygalactose transaminase
MANLYLKHLKDLFIHCDYKNFNHGGFINFPILLPSEDIKFKLKKILLLNGFDCADKLYRNVHNFQEYNKINGYSTNLEKIINRVIFLPTHPAIKKSDVLMISKLIKDEISYIC